MVTTKSREIGMYSGKDRIDLRSVRFPEAYASPIAKGVVRKIEKGYLKDAALEIEMVGDNKFITHPRKFDILRDTVAQEITRSDEEVFIEVAEALHEYSKQQGLTPRGKNDRSLEIGLNAISHGMDPLLLVRFYLSKGTWIEMRHYLEDRLGHDNEDFLALKEAERKLQDR